MFLAVTAAAGATVGVAAAAVAVAAIVRILFCLLSKIAFRNAMLGIKLRVESDKFVSGERPLSFNQLSIAVLS